MKRVKPELIQILNINIYKSIVNTTEEHINMPVGPSNFRVGFAQNSSFSFENRNVRIRLDVIIEGIDEKENTVGLTGEFGIEFHFHVENFDEFVELKEGKKKVSFVLGLTLLNIAYSTARGLILERTHGTYFNGIIIPVIDTHELMKTKHH